MNAKNVDQRKKPYKDTIEITEKTIGYSEKGLKALTSCGYKPEGTSVGIGFTQQLLHYQPLVRQVGCLRENQSRLRKKLSQYLKNTLTL